MNFLEVEKKLAKRIENTQQYNGHFTKDLGIFALQQTLDELRKAIYSKDSQAAQSLLWGKCPKCDNYLDHSGHCHNCEPLARESIRI